MKILTRKRVIVAIIILVVVFLLYFVFFFGRKTPQPVQSDSALGEVSEPATVTDSGAIITTNVPVAVQSDAQIEITRLATLYAERYGSFSNQANFKNIIELYDFMTPELQTDMARYVAEKSKENQLGQEYYGIDTRVLSVSIETRDDTTAHISVNTQRSEAHGERSNTNRFFQKILIDLVKINGIWKVSSAVWQ